MSQMQPIKGTKDLLPEEYAIHEKIIEVAKENGRKYGFAGMSTPILEYTQVFDRTLGETSDVVSKEMYSFLDKGGRNVSLRPEFTAGIMRAVISNQLQHSLPARFFSFGPVFRYDNPQAGRQRQFHQINFETIGIKDPYVDAEIIKLSADILLELGILKDTTLELNSLGCPDSRANYQTALFEYFSKYENELSQESKRRLQTNPLRILDSKDAGDQKIASEVPLIDAFYTPEASSYFDQVKKYLDILSVSYFENKRLARGLDYYSHTAFEFTTSKLGAQSTVLAGGRYDGLCRVMGGGDVPAIGFAGGIERLALLFDYKNSANKNIFILPIDQAQISIALKIANTLRTHNFPVVIDAQGKVSKRMQKLVKLDAKFVIFIGENEALTSILKVKNMQSEQEFEVSVDNLLEFFENSQ